MKRIIFSHIVAAIIINLSCSHQVVIPETELHQANSFNASWKFALDDSVNAFAENFDDSEWRILDVPHDWSIEGQFEKENPSGWRGGYMPGGTGWYRKSFSYNPVWKGKKVTIVFDGVYMNSTVWLNGHNLGQRPYGYSTFFYDLTPFLKEGDNVLAVRVDNSQQPSGRWYTGCGIYRNVWLLVDNHIHIPVWGVHVTPIVLNESAQVDIVTDIVNTTGKAVEATVKQQLLNSNNEIITQVSANMQVDEEKSSFRQSLSLENVDLWSPENPHIYKVQTTILVQDSVVDSKTTTTGFRTLDFRADNGFWLNGENIKIKGVCLHHEAGNLGAAVPDEVWHRRLRILKEMGCNAIRTSHNPFAPEFYHMCDTMGFMVMNEAFDGWDVEKAPFDYGLYFEEWWDTDLRDFLLRDRNHPSVIMWSIGNEVVGRTDSIEQLLVDLVRKYDTRPVTIGASHDARIVDIAGFNGVGEGKNVLEEANANHPDWPIIGTEVPHSWQTRGIYRTKTWIRGRDYPAPWNPERMGVEVDTNTVYYVDDLTEEEVFPGIDINYLSSYDNAFVRISSREQWERTKNLDFMMGEFRWTGIDYLGENIYPNRGWHCGVIDLCGFPKDTYYFYQSKWTTKPMVHMFPHWTHNGKEGIEIPIMAYTNAEEEELFVNGISLGTQKVEDKWNLLWYVPYQPGELKIVARTNGEEVAVETVKTAGLPYAIELEIYKSQFLSGKVIHISFKINDENGTVVPDADNLVRFEVSGPARLLAMENGDMMDHTLSTEPYRKAFKGLGLAYILIEKGDDPVQIKAIAEGLVSDELQLSVN